MIREKYDLWVKRAVKDPDLIPELKKMEKDENEMSEAFYKDLEFGTAGLRGIIGAGTNRLNVYTVGKATQGLAAYVNSVTNNGSVAISYDSRIKSELFAHEAASVFAANGIKVYIYKELMPVPMLSFAVRKLKCNAGVMITASHNPSKYNGYKAYDETGCQLGPEAADYVLNIMNSVDIFEGIKSVEFDEAVNDKRIEYIGDDVINEYLDKVESARVNKDLDLSDLKIIYTPLNGAGNKPVREILKRIGIKDVTIVKEQELPDGNFPTAPYPNPEIRECFNVALSLAEKVKPDILLATDPDCDRVGVAIPYNNEYRLISGNDMGVLMLNYILSVRKQLGTLPANPVAVKTIVSSELCKEIAKKYGCELKEVLTGFKFIGEQITNLEKAGEEERFIFGYEESYGYLIGAHARDKDAVVASMIICEMTAYYKAHGINLIDQLNNIYEEFGYFLTLQKSFTSEGQAGLKKIADTMVRIRENPPENFGTLKVSVLKDIQKGEALDLQTKKKSEILLPRSNVLAFYFTDGSSAIIRPSGTEPKIKIYVNAVGKTKEEAEKVRETILLAGEKILGF
ncbi:MAG: phospho-sugar mutase [Clostridia bacterium]|nr:phospho-sugar mutase [Clostridia bacterium]